MRNKYLMKMFLRTVAVTLAVTLLCIMVSISLPAVKASVDESEFKCWAVFIGLSEYQHIDSTEGCAEAATSFYETISRIWKEEQCRLLINEEATKYKIREAMNWLADNAAADDTVLIYYAGHGDPAGHLSTYRSYYVDTWISAIELNSWLHNIDSQKITVVLDSCHSGRFIPPLKRDGRVILTSSKTNEVSYVIPGLGGIFTINLLDAIHDFIDTSRVQDFDLTMEELFETAEPNIIQDTTDYTETTQHPSISDEYNGELSLLIHFVVATNPVVPATVKIYSADGEDYRRTSIQTWAPGSAHNIEILTPIDNGKGTKYLFNSWEDGMTSPVRVISTEGKYMVNFDTQYRLEIVSDFGNPEGPGWYAENTIATIFIESIDEPAEKHHFTSWSGDYSGDENAAEINMDAPKTITANWHTEYLMNIESAHGEPAGAGWYDEGDIATVEIESVETLDARHHFTGWTGDYDGNKNSFDIRMGSPKSVTANWHSEYLLSIESDHGKPAGSGWYDDGDTAQVSLEPVERADARHDFLGWSGDYTGNVSDFEITIDSPKSLTANWHSEYLVTITSDYGETTGEGWYDEGSTATISVPDSNGFLVRKVFDGWSGDFDGTSATARVEIENAISITAQWRTDFLQLYIFVGVLVIAAVVTYFLLRRKRRTLVI